VAFKAFHLRKALNETGSATLEGSRNVTIGSGTSFLALGTASGGFTLSGRNTASGASGLGSFVKFGEFVESHGGRLGGLEMLQSIHGGHYYVHLVVGADTLGKNILNSGKFDDGTNSTTSNDGCSLPGGLQENAACTVILGDFVWNTSILGNRNLDQVLLSIENSFLNGGLDLKALSDANANATVTIADDDESAEPETTTTLYNAGDAVNLNYDLFELGPLLGLLIVLIWTCHGVTRVIRLKLETTLAGGIGQSGNATMVVVSASIESDGGYLLGLSQFSNVLSNQNGNFGFGTGSFQSDIAAGG
jgi:hypothetical protein